ncbi:hypothetical protein BCV69DRAFT_301897 [Microstroma glucosiphilum]|uniref:Uncharacterized protein n=1 Tax=Pseudomicrostroma glucosiphilum TaxID=1684307 RepID=A0A316TZM6_9BASI|nr:hypothetical protein BCV69DRAFT_301897 [Pseudomicrostroma glucosiphilum]PWN17713.1 hypothetical protein BCV69DRAFT_301897 [Pseudomicrostroma glucosiphilum]
MPPVAEGRLQGDPEQVNEEQSCAEEAQAASPTPNSEVEQPAPPPKQVNITELHSLPDIVSALGQRLPEVDDEKLAKLAELLQPPKQIDITSLDSLRAITSALKHRLPEVDDQTIAKIAEVQQNANSIASKRVRLAQAKGRSDISEDLAMVKEHTTPLNRENWFQWRQELRLNMVMVSYADELLFGEDEIEYTPFLEELDRKLVATIYLTLDADGPVAVRYQYLKRRHECSNGRELLKLLESELKPGGHWKQVWTLYKLYKVSLVNDDIDKAIEKIDRWAYDAWNLGVPVPEAHKCAMLLKLTIGKEPYRVAWTQLQSEKACNDWIAVSSALRWANEFERTSYR